MIVLLGLAHAFCGTYVAGADSTIYNRASAVALVRQDGRTTLSMANDVQGDFADFALVVPVPTVLTEDDIHVLDGALFDALDRYSQPRLVEYLCEDFEEADADSDTDSDSDTDTDLDTDSVNVEAEYIVGEYEVVILSAQQSEGLVQWLNTNGYAVPETSTALLAEYLDGGSYFFAAKVGTGAGVRPGDTLSPLQVSYESEVFVLPIRLGTLNSEGVQDLVIYALNEADDGALGIMNYPEVSVEDNCMAPPSSDFSELVAGLFDDAYASKEGAVWAREYSWGEGKCDPCSGTPPAPVDFATLGYDLDEGGSPHFTRLHVRYTPEEAHSDLGLYATGRSYIDQLWYVQYNPYLQDRWPICGQGWLDDPQTCDDLDPPAARSPTSRCASGPGPAALWLAGLLLAATLRPRASRGG